MDCDTGYATMLRARGVGGDGDVDEASRSEVSSSSSTSSSSSKSCPSSVPSDSILVPQDNLPEEFFCPITLNVMKNPVLAADGHTYEKKAISRWFAGGQRRSPKTNQQLPHTALIPNHALRALIQDRLEQRASRK